MNIQDGMNILDVLAIMPTTSVNEYLGWHEIVYVIYIMPYYIYEYSGWNEYCGPVGHHAALHMYMNIKDGMHIVDMLAIMLY